MRDTNGHTKGEHEQHEDPGDVDPDEYRRDRRITTPELLVGTARPSDADPWSVTLPRRTVVGASTERDPATRFLSMSGKLLDAARLMLSQGIELQSGRVGWTEDMRREWGGRLRRMGVDIDTFLSSTLP